MQNLEQTGSRQSNWQKITKRLSTATWKQLIGWEDITGAWAVRMDFGGYELLPHWAVAQLRLISLRALEAWEGIPYLRSKVKLGLRWLVMLVMPMLFSHEMRT